MNLAAFQAQVAENRDRLKFNAGQAQLALVASIGRLMEAEGRCMEPGMSADSQRHNAALALKNALKCLSAVASDWGISLEDLASS